MHCITLFSIFLINFVDQTKSINLNSTKTQLKNSNSAKYILLWQGYQLRLNWELAPDTEPYIGPNFFKEYNCPVTSCYLTHNRSMLSSIDQFNGILFDSRQILPINQRPKVRASHQVYIFATNEPPPLVLPENRNMKQENNFYNWTMTYRIDSEIQWPYTYKIIDKESGLKMAPKRNTQWRNYDDKFFDENLLKSVKSKVKMISWFVSNCITSSKRNEITEKLQEFIEVDVYGDCGPLDFDGATDHKKFIEENYKFYLSFENSLCTEYVTEKFSHIFGRNVIPIVLGGANYTHYAPPHSYINVDDYATVKDLADYLKYLDKNPEEYVKYFWWKQYYHYINNKESYFFCNLCEQINNEELTGSMHSYSDLYGWFADCRNEPKIQFS